MSRTKPSLSPDKLTANRENAAHSTGPRTPEGKANSAQNARKHGFTASTFAVVRLEDLQEIGHLKADLLESYQPVNSQELFAVERIALAQQNLLRAGRLHSGLLTTCLNESLDSSGSPLTPMSEELVGDGDIEITRAQNRNYALAEGFRRLARESNIWSLYLRYEAQAERHFRRAVEEFHRLRRGPCGVGLPASPPEIPNEPTAHPDPQHNTPTYTQPETNPTPPITALPPIGDIGLPDPRFPVPARPTPH